MCLIGKRESRFGRCSAASATVRTLALFHCENREGIGQVFDESKYQSVVSRETCRRFRKTYFCGEAKKGKENRLYTVVFAYLFYRFIASEKDFFYNREIYL